MNIKDKIRQLPADEHLLMDAGVQDDDGCALTLLAGWSDDGKALTTDDLKALAESHGRLLVVAKWLDAHLDDYFIDKLPKDYTEAKAAIEEAEKL